MSPAPKTVPKTAPGQEFRHASTVAFAHGDDWAGLMISGVSGAGKSELALELVALGARLVADDQTLLRREGDRIFATSHAALSGVIEMRGIGLLAAPPLARARIVTIVDLDQPETARLPELRLTPVLGVPIRCLYRVSSRAFPAALRQYMLGAGWQRDPAVT